MPVTASLKRMEKNQMARQRAIGDILRRSGGPPEQVLADGMLAWEQLAAHLSSLIGEAGFCALYARAFAVAGAPETLVRSSASLRSIDSLVEQLRAGLATLEPAQARDVNAAVLDTFTKLLSGLIGDGLTARLLNTAWAARSEGNRNES
jgi:hypothetical protein